MKYKLPTPSVKITIIQITAAVVFSVSLFCFLFFNGAKQFLTTQIKQLEQQQVQLAAKMKKIDHYEELLAKNPDFVETVKSEIWKKVDIVWQDISLAELLRRLEGLYNSSEIFIFDSFAVKYIDRKNGTGQIGQGEEGIAPPAASPIRQYLLKGRFLW